MAIEGVTNPTGDPNPAPTPGAPNAGDPNPQPKAGEPKPPVAGDPKPPVDPRQAGVLADLQKERKARQTLERQVADMTARLDISDKRARALLGVEPVSEEEAEAAEIRGKFSKMFPALAKLNDDQMLEKLTKLIEKSDSSESMEERYWNDRAESMTQSVVEAVAEEIGSDLTPRQITKLRAAYAHRAATDQDFLARHEAGDKKLAAEFAAEFVEDWFEPARKKVTREQVERNRPVPGGGRDRSIGAKKPRTIDFKNEKDVSDAMVESFRSHGGQFSS